MVQNTEQLELVREEIRVSSLFSHPNLLPLLDHAIISVKVISQSGYSYLIYNCYSYYFLNIKLDAYRIVTWLLLWLDYFSIKLMVSNHSFSFFLVFFIKWLFLLLTFQFSLPLLPPSLSLSCTSLLFIKVKPPQMRLPKKGQIITTQEERKQELDG